MRGQTAQGEQNSRYVEHNGLAQAPEKQHRAKALGTKTKNSQGVLNVQKLLSIVTAVFGGVMLASAQSRPIWQTWKLKTWTDRRPIGLVGMCFNNQFTITNPNGWNWGGVNDLGGQTGWAKAAISFMKGVIAHCLGMGAQGIIVWDIEGEPKVLHGPAIFLGDPRVASTTAPEMNTPGLAGNSAAGIPSTQSVSDYLFTLVRAAGLKTGVMTRAQLLNLAANTQTTYSSTLHGVTDLESKMDYANTRWGCTMFYLDSNDVGQPGYIQQVHIDRPQYLISPEHWGNDQANGLSPSATTQNQFVPYGAGFNFLAGTGPGVKSGGTGDILNRATFPLGFDLVDCSHSPMDLADMTTCAAAGDILLWGCWTISAETPNVEAALRAAGRFTGTGNFQ